MRPYAKRLVLAVAVVPVLGLVLWFLVNAENGAHVIHFSPTP